MKVNPIDTSDAPTYLPTQHQLTQDPMKYVREARWMAWKFWDLVREIEDLQKAMEEKANKAYEEGYQEGSVGYWECPVCNVQFNP